MIHFGTGGWRAVIGDGFTRANIELLAKAMADKMHAENVADKGIVFGYDRRFLSKEAMRWAAQVFAAEGICCELINKSGPTPQVMYYVSANDLPYGMMITASHNPAVYNGVKVFTAGGRDADEAQTAEIERYAQAVDPAQIRSMDYDEALKAGLIREIYPINQYLDSILTEINVIAIREAGLSVVVDPMYGVSESSIKTILLTARCEVETIHGWHDPLFGGKLPAPNEEAMRPLGLAVMERHADIGIATDGDADRIGVVDDKGRYLSPNDIMVLLYYYLVKYKNRTGAVVRNLCTTHRLDRIAEQFGQKAYEVPVGFKYISSKMSEVSALIGGESSGGITVRGHIRGKDGIYAAALLVEMLAVTGQKLSEIYEEINREFGRTEMVEKNYRFKDAQRGALQDRLMVEKALPEFDIPVLSVSYMDGVKVYFEGGGWVSARFSGTEPLLRIFSEMPTEAEALAAAETFRAFLGLEA